MPQSLTRLWAIFFKIGFTIGGALPLWLLAGYCFNETSVYQHANAIAGINMTAIWIPVVLAIMSMVAIHFYPISDDNVNDINRQLDEIRV